METCTLELVKIAQHILAVIPPLTRMFVFISFFFFLEKAFDHAPQGVLWEVFQEYGVSGLLLRLAWSAKPVEMSGWPLPWRSHEEFSQLGGAQSRVATAPH